MFKNQPLKILLKITIIISIVEYLFMLVSGYLDLPSKFESPYLAAIDVVVLALITAPLVYYFVLTPYVRARDNALSKVTRAAELDPLTKLFNRRGIKKHFNAFVAGRNADEFAAVFLLDLDGFKTVNDTYGHDIGDQLLVSVAQRLRESSRPYDFVCRLGGDEFVVLYTGLNKDNVEAAIEKLSDKLLTVLAQPYVLDSKELKVGASLGIKTFNIGESDLYQHISDADEAMYSAKTAGKGRAVIYEVK